MDKEVQDITTVDSTSKPVKGADEKYCSECAEIIKEKAEICPKCGVRQKTSISSATTTATEALAKKTASGRNKWIAIIIALFLGFLGGHKFYLGQKGLGIVYLLFCWTGIPALVTLVDIVLLLLMNDHDFDKRFG